MKVELIIVEQTYEMSLVSDNGQYTATVTLPGIKLDPEDLGSDVPVTIRVTDDSGETQDFAGYTLHVLPAFSVIIDRTQVDVDEAKALQQSILAGTATSSQIEQYKQDSKGTLNTSDLVPNWKNVHIVADMLGVTDIEEPERPEIPTVSYYQALIDAVSKLQEKRLLYSDTPITPNNPLNTFRKWNDIEKILLDYYTILTASQSSINYCGDQYFCGDLAGTIM